MISEYLTDQIRPALRKKTNVFGTNDVTNHDCSYLQINLNKMCKLVTELSPSTKIVLAFIILCLDKNNAIVKANRGNEIIKHLCKTNKLDLMDNSNTKAQKLYCKNVKRSFI